MRTVSLLVLGFVSWSWSCSGPARPLPPPAGPAVPALTGEDGAAVVPSVLPGTEHRVIIMEGKQIGTYDTSTAADGTVTAVYHVLQNGRGPHVEARYKLGADGALDAFDATGHHEMGTTIAETYRREGGRARWKSLEEAGERALTAPAFYVSISDLPMEGQLVRAAIAAGGTLALLPAGEARVEKVAEVEVKAGGRSRAIHGYRVSGLKLTPSYQWMNPDGTWFGFSGAWEAAVPAGWEDVVETLKAERRALEQARLSELARTSAHKPPPAGLAYIHARVLDVEKGTWLRDMTVVVVGDTITAMGPSMKVKPPAGAEVVDIAGQMLVPGLVDMHGHVEAIDGVLDIASGVTTVRDVGNNPDELDALKQQWDAGTMVGPHLIRFGFIEGRGEKAASAKITAETPDEAKAAVAFYAERGYEGIKIYNSMKVELVPLLTADAHARKMLVSGHIPVHMLANEAVKAGYDGIEHINMLFLNFLATHETDTRDTTRFTLVGEKGAGLDLDSAPVKEFIKLLHDRGTVIDPTLAAFEDLWVGVPGTISPGLELLVARLPVQSGRAFLKGGLPLSGDTHATYVKSWERVLAMVKKLHDAKVTLVLGTDHVAGVMMHHEAELFARAGIPNAAIMKMATIGAARSLGMDKRFGSVAKGKRADLVVLDGDPLLDIKALQRVVSTMRGGVVYRSAELYKSVGVKPLVD